MIQSIFNYIIKQVGRINHRIFGSTWVKEKKNSLLIIQLPHTIVFSKHQILAALRTIQSTFWGLINFFFV